MSNIKAIAIAKLKNNESIEKIANDLDISKAIIQEWCEELDTDDLVAKEVNAIAINKACKIIDYEAEIVVEQDSEKLQRELYSVALAIVDEVKLGMHDDKIARALNISSDTVTKLQLAFFGKIEPTIALVNNNNANNNDKALSVFKGAMRK